jgi:formylmethanofuran dehydrogenase subunit E
MPTAELLSAVEVELLLDLDALIARPGIRVNCSNCGEEILNQREVIQDGTMLCRSCAGSGYVRYVSD